MDLEAAEKLFLACDQDRDGFISRQDLERICDDLQLEESVEDLMHQFGADEQGQVSYAQFLLCHKKIQLTPMYQNPVDFKMMPEVDATTAETKVCRRRDNAKNAGKLKGTRHWDWLGQALDAGYDKPIMSKEQLLLERRQRLQGKIQREDALLHDAAHHVDDVDVDDDGKGVPTATASSISISCHQQDPHDTDVQIMELTQRLAQVTVERDQLRQQDPERYEERIVELHSVIAELSRKLELGKDDVIPEESEVEEEEENEGSYVSDSCLDDEDHDDDVDLEDDEQRVPYDHDSLAFERDLEKDEHLYVDKNTLYKLELFDELQSEVAETRSDNERLRQVISNRDQELEESGRTINHLQTERESLKRQLEDLQNTLEYQEAKMDRSSGRSSAERRSLRRKKSSTGKPPISPAVLDSEKITVNSHPSSTTIKECQNISGLEQKKFREMELELAKAQSQVDHLKSQNEVLELTMEDAKTTNEKFSINLARHESNATALQLALAYADQAIEAYDVLVALLETEVAAVVTSSSATTASSSSYKDVEADLKLAQSNKRSALSVARHLICRYDKTYNNHRTDSGMGSDHHGSTSWEADSSGYSHTTSSTTSTNSSSCPIMESHCETTIGSSSSSGGSNNNKSEENRLREHICQLKTIRATIQGTVLDLDPFHSTRMQSNNECHQPTTASSAALRTNASEKCLADDQLETAVLKQELMAAREEMADLKAKIYVSDREKSGLELTLQERRAVETMLRTHVQYLQEQASSAIMSSPSTSSQSSKTEELLRQRVENLLEALDNVIRNSEARHKQSKELIDDLKKANSTLSEALDKAKRKYQSKIKRLQEQQLNQHEKA